MGSPGGAAVPGGRPATLSFARQGTIRTLSRLGGAGTALTTAGAVGGVLGVSEPMGDVGTGVGPVSSGTGVVGTGVVGTGVVGTGVVGTGVVGTGVVGTGVVGAGVVGFGDAGPVRPARLGRLRGGGRPRHVGIAAIGSGAARGRDGALPGQEARRGALAGRRRGHRRRV